MRNIEDRSIPFAIPLIDGHLCIGSESNNGLHIRPLGLRVQLVAPVLLSRVAQDLWDIGSMTGKERVDEGVKAEVGACEPKLGQEPLDPLTGVTHQRPQCDTLSWTRIRCDAEQVGTAIQPAAVENRSPVIPEVLLERTIIRSLCKKLCKLRWWTRIELNHQEAPFDSK